MSNFKDDILAAFACEPIEFIRLELDDWGLCSSNLADRYLRTIPKDCLYKVLPWDNATIAMLDFEYDDGFGAQDCPNVTIWSANKVGYVHEYDGSTEIRTLDRNPCEGAYNAD